MGSPLSNREEEKELELKTSVWGGGGRWRKNKRKTTKHGGGERKRDPPENHRSERWIERRPLRNLKRVRKPAGVMR